MSRLRGNAVLWLLWLKIHYREFKPSLTGWVVSVAN